MDPALIQRELGNSSPHPGWLHEHDPAQRLAGAVRVQLEVAASQATPAPSILESWSSPARFSRGRALGWCLVLRLETANSRVQFDIRFVSAGTRKLILPVTDVPA